MSRVRPRECDQRLTWAFRTLAGNVERAEERLADLRQEWESERSRVLRGLSLPEWLPMTPFGLDVLERIEETDDGHWIWHGMFNNHGTPTVSVSETKTEGTAYRFLHKLLRGEPDRGAMHPLCTTPRCVLPQHRCRACAGGSHPLIGCTSLPTMKHQPASWDGVRPLDRRAS